MNWPTNFLRKCIKRLVTLLWSHDFAFISQWFSPATCFTTPFRWPESNHSSVTHKLILIMKLLSARRLIVKQSLDSNAYSPKYTCLPFSFIAETSIDPMFSIFWFWFPVKMKKKPNQKVKHNVIRPSDRLLIWCLCIFCFLSLSLAFFDCFYKSSRQDDLSAFWIVRASRWAAQHSEIRSNLRDRDSMCVVSIMSRQLVISVLLTVMLIQLTAIVSSAQFDSFTGIPCDTCGNMCGKYCGQRVFKACCYSHNKRSIGLMSAKLSPYVFGE